MTRRRPTLGIYALALQWLGEQEPPKPKKVFVPPVLEMRVPNAAIKQRSDEVTLAMIAYLEAGGQITYRKRHRRDRRLKVDGFVRRNNPHAKGKRAAAYVHKTSSDNTHEQEREFWR